MGCLWLMMIYKRRYLQEKKVSKTIEGQLLNPKAWAGSGCADSLSSSVNDVEQTHDGGPSTVTDMSVVTMLLFVIWAQLCNNYTQVERINTDVGCNVLNMLGFVISWSKLISYFDTLTALQFAAGHGPVLKKKAFTYNTLARRDCIKHFFSCNVVVLLNLRWGHSLFIIYNHTDPLILFFKFSCMSIFDTF